MQRTGAEAYWLGAETQPGDLAEINRVCQAWRDSTARDQRFGSPFRPLGLITLAMRWLKNSPTRMN
jgi:hypothetical protein